MIKLQTLGLATLIGFAGAVLAQTPSPSTTTNTDARTSSSQSQDTLGQQPGSSPSSPSQSQDPSQTQDPATTGTPPISGSDTTSPDSTTSSGSATPPATSSEEDDQSADSMRTASADMSKPGKADKHRGSKLIGKNVETSSGDTIGEVKDLVIDDGGKVTHLIVSHGRLGSTKLAAVPYETAKQMMRADKLVIDKTRLENAPSFDEASYPDMSSSTWSSSADRYWERSRSASAAGATDTGSTGTATSDDATSDDSSSSSSDPSTSSPSSSTPETPDSSMPPSTPSSPDSTTPGTEPTNPTDPTDPPDPGTAEPSSTETPPPG